MTSPDVALIITAISTAITAVGGLVIAVSVLVPTMRASKKAVAAVQEVHTIVNQQRTDAQRYQAVLVNALQSAGVAVPNDESLREDVPGRAASTP